MFLLLVLAYLTGVACTLAVIVVIVIRLINDYQGSRLPQPLNINQFSSSIIPKALLGFYAARKETPEKACLGINALLMFLFQEMKNSDILRSWFRKKVEIELRDLKKHAALRLVLRDLKLHSFNLGKSLPIIHVVKVNTEPKLDSQNMLESVDVTVDLSYAGELEMSLEALVSFDKSVMITCKLVSLTGQARLLFSRHPYTHWSFSFTSEPYLVLDLKSNISGRNVPQIVIPVLTNQIKRVLRKKHTLPAYKMRVRPFFTDTTYKERSKKVIAGAHSLQVTIVSCSRLSIDLANSFGLFCIISTGNEKYLPRLPYEEHTFSMTLLGEGNQRMQGLSLKKVQHTLLRQEVVWIEKVKPGSPASLAGLAKGDIITRVNNESFTTADPTYIRYLLTDPKVDSVTLSVAQIKPPAGTLLPSKSDPSLTRVGESSMEGSASTDPVVTSVEQQKGHKRSASKTVEKDTIKQVSAVTSSELQSQKNKYITSTVTCSSSPEFTERITMMIDSESVYMNIAVFSVSKHTMDQSNIEQPEPSVSDSLIGYASLSLHDVLGECAANPQGDSQLMVNLSAPPDMDSLPSYPGARDIDVSKCYGDITLRFATKGISTDNPVSPEDAVKLNSEYVDVDTLSLTSATSVPDSLPNSQPYSNGASKTTSSSRHVFREKAFTQKTTCNFCLKKIWMKKAMQCEECHMITHKKCVDQCQTTTSCSHQPISATDSLTQPSKVSRSESIIQRLSRRKSHVKAAVDLGTRRRFKRLSELQTTEGAEYSSSEELYTTVDTAGNTETVSLAEDSSSDEELAFEFMEDFLSKQGKSTAAEESDELAITAAKQMGKELYASLCLEERKCKLESMVEKLQSEIEMVSLVRDEHEKSLKSCATAPQRDLITARINKANEKIQALAVLLVHYCSGLQDCAEQIHKDSSSPSEPVSRESSPKPPAEDQQPVTVSQTDTLLEDKIDLQDNVSDSESSEWQSASDIEECTDH